jgi:hypothetical protein
MLKTLTLYPIYIIITEMNKGVHCNVFLIQKKFILVSAFYIVICNKSTCYEIKKDRLPYHSSEVLGIVSALY